MTGGFNFKWMPCCGKQIILLDRFDVFFTTFAVWGKTWSAKQENMHFVIVLLCSYWHYKKIN